MYITAMVLKSNLLKLFLQTIKVPPVYKIIEYLKLICLLRNFQLNYKISKNVFFFFSFLTYNHV